MSVQLPEHVEQVQSGNYRVRIQRDGRVYRSRVVGSLGEAITKRAEMLARLVGEPTPPQVVGVTAGEADEDFEEEVYARAVAAFARTEAIERRKHSQSVTFTDSLHCVVFVGDVHLGDEGTDHARAFQEGELISVMPRTSVWLMGDLVNQFVLKELHDARFEAPITIQEEWALLRRYLRILGPQIIGSNGSNKAHDGWVFTLTGIDFFKEVLADFAPQALYDHYDIRVLFKFPGGWEVPARMRHKWRGNSQWNSTHAIEKAAKFDGDFTLGVGAHFHGNGLARPMNIGGVNGMAALVGSYKRYDDYGDQIQAGIANDVTCVPIIFDAINRTMMWPGTLEFAARIMAGLK